MILSASEDGTIKQWDVNSMKCVHTFEYNNSSNNSSKYISSIDVDKTDNWMIAGGGEKYLTLWNLPTMSIASYMPTASATNIVKFIEDDSSCRIVSGGNTDSFLFWKITGHYVSKTGTSKAQSIYSISEATINNKKVNMLLCPVIKMNLANCCCWNFFLARYTGGSVQ